MARTPHGVLVRLTPNVAKMVPLDERPGTVPLLTVCREPTMRSNRLPLLLSLTASIALIVSSVAVASPNSASNGDTIDVIVALDDGAAPGGHEANKARAAQIAREHGVEPSQTYGTALFGFAASVPQARLNGLRNDPRVDYVDRDAPVEAYGQTTPWGITRVGAPVPSNRGAGIHVYVLDTGIDSDHPDLEANLSTDGHAVESCKGPGHRCKQPWDDDHGHGTHVAGTVAAVDNGIDVVGVAPEATLHAVKVLSNSGSGSRSGVIAGIDWVTHHVGSNGYGGKAVANMSLGGSGSKSGTCSSTGFSGSDSYHESICSSKNAGVVFAVAAGNSNADAAEHVPAAYDDAVITVSATKEGDDWPYWSNWGDDSADWAPWDSAPVAIAAPGAGVLSTALGGGTTTMSGTSMAAPHVAGAVALYLEANRPSADGTAFANARSTLLTNSEETWDGEAYVNGWSNTSGYVHREGFLNLRGDMPPTVAVAAPDDGDTVAGTVTITANASDKEGVTQVEFLVDATVIATDTTAADGWSTSWDTTTSTESGALYPDGSHTVTARATDTAGQTASHSVTVSVDNVNDRPNVTITSPTEASTVSGNVDVTADASDDRGVKSVSFSAGGSLIGTDSDGSDGWSTPWDTTGLDDGVQYTITATATDTDGATGSHAVTVTVDNSTPAPSPDLFITSPSGTDGYATTGGQGDTLHLLVTVSLNTAQDGSGSAVDGTVYVEICRSETSGGPCVSTVTGSGSTSGGSVTFKWTKAPSGSYYRTTVTSVVTLDGATHDQTTLSTPSNEYLKP